MGRSQDLRGILSRNIRKTRLVLHISQAKLAEYAGISVSHILDIEYCKTWVSDKTLSSIAEALNMEVYELLKPEKGEKTGETGPKNAILRQTSDLIKTKRNELRKKINGTMDDLILEIIKLHTEKSP